MNTHQLQKIIKGGEGLTVEFKECRGQVNRDVYESICAFLNRNGGHIILGVQDNGIIKGVDPDALTEQFRFFEIMRGVENRSPIPCEGFYEFEDIRAGLRIDRRYRQSG